MNQRKTQLKLGLLVAVFLASTSAAAVQPGGMSVSVSYDDLNIDSRSGASALYKRLQRASRAVCDMRTLREAGSVSEFRRASSCYAATLDTAVRGIESATLQRIHSG